MKTILLIATLLGWQPSIAALDADEAQKWLSKEKGWHFLSCHIQGSLCPSFEGCIVADDHGWFYVCPPNWKKRYVEK